MKTYIPRPSEVFDGPRSPLVEQIMVDIVDNLPGPGDIIETLICPDPLGRYPDWLALKTVKEVERLLVARGWTVEVSPNKTNQWNLRVTNPA